MKETNKLLWREFLRGYITATKESYDLAKLKAVYRNYMKLNPAVKKDIKLLQDLLF